MESHIPTLETCQRLKAAGFPQETSSLLCWYSSGKDYHLDYSNFGLGQRSLKMVCVAPLLTEILEQIKLMFGAMDDDRIVRIWHSDSPAEAAALLWLELKEGE